MLYLEDTASRDVHVCHHQALAYPFVVLLIKVHSSHALEAPANPARFTVGLHEGGNA
jgi:hypothetical protein